MRSFINCFQSEWIKRRRSLASWIIIIGSFFTPVIIIIARLLASHNLNKTYNLPNYWNILWKNCWESMAIFLLPLCIILFTSLITQIEYKNNTWKQLHTLPLNFRTIFFTKFAVIIVMLLQFLLIFNIGIYLSTLLPYLLISNVEYPRQTIPYALFLKENLFYLIDCLPIVALQYLISLKFKNFLVSVGTGFLFWFGALAALTWKYGYIIPYTYCMFNYLKDAPGGKVILPTLNIHYFALGYFIFITILNYVIYIHKNDKG